MALNQENSQVINMKLSQLKNIMNKNYLNTGAYIEEILKTGYELDASIKRTPHLESKQPKLIGCTALHLAFMENCIEGFETLLEAGSNYTIKNRDGLTVLHQILEDFYKNESVFRLNTDFATSINSRHSNNLVNPCTSYGLSHFHAACLCNNADLVNSFLESGVSVDDAVKMDAPCFPGYTPLHFAVRSYGYETVQILLEKGSNQNLVNAEKKTPLLMLLEQKIKLKSCSDVSTLVPEDQLYDALDNHEQIIHLLYNNNGCVNFSDFHLACTMTDSSLLERILENGVDVNSAIDQDSPLWPGFTGLHFAALCNFESAMLLLKKGAKIEAKNAAGVSAFDMCLNLYGPEEISMILSIVDYWKDIVLSDNQTALSELVKTMGNSEQFEAFLENSAGVLSAIVPTDSALWPGFTVLHVAVQLLFKDLETVNTCLKAGADVRTQSADGSSALHLAFRREKKDLVKLLLQHHREKLSNLRDVENLSVLHIACASSGNKEFVKNLLQSGLDVNVAYRGKPIGESLRSGFTPLHVAVASGNHELTRLLLEHEADRYAADSDGFTPLHWVLAAPDPDKVGAEFFVSVDDVRESIVSGLSHLHVASYVKNVGYLDNHKFTRNDEFMKQLLAMPQARIDVAVVYNENSSPSFLSGLAGATPFCLALKKENWTAASKLAESGCDILRRQSNGSVPLFETLNACDWNAGRELVSMWRSNEEAQRRVQEDIGLTRLHLACYVNDVQEIARSLTDGANPNGRIRLDSPLWPGYTPLHILVRYKMMHPHTINALLHKFELDFDCAVENADGDTALHLAYKHENGNYLDDLIRKHTNYNVNPANDAGLTYFHIFCSVMCRYDAQKFLDAGVDVDRAIDPFCDDASIAGQTPLHVALSPKCFFNYTMQLSPIVDALLRNGARVNPKDAIGDTPLHKAVKLDKAKFDVLEIVVNAGADVNTLNAFCEDPWCLLLSNGDFSAEQLELFISNGCRLNVYSPVEKNGYVSLAFYNNGSQSEAKRILFDAMLNHPRTIDTDEKGRTVVHCLAANSETELSCDEYAKLVEQLLILSDNECDIDDRDYEGRTALHMAAYQGNHSAIEGLLLAGADINVGDNYGYFTFDYLAEEDSDNEATVIAKHVKKLEILKLTASAKNRDFAASVFERLDVDEASLRETVLAEFELARSVEIPVGSFSLSLRDFLTETYNDTTINASTGDGTGKSIKRFFRDFKDERFAELRSILKLQYRKAMARRGLIERASDALDRVSRCTVKCAELVAKFLSNDELKSMIEARTKIDD